MDAFVVTLREGFEAALIIGIIFAFLKKTDRLGANARAIWLGVGAAIAFSVAVGALLFLTLGELEGVTEALYEGLAMLLAAGVLTWMVFWMRRQARTIGQSLRDQVSDAIAAGSGIALASIAFVAVAREGLETALFMFAINTQDAPLVSAAGATLGILVAVVLGVAVYRGAVRINLNKFFAITGVLVIGLASFLLMGALHELGEAGAGEALEGSAPVVAALYGVVFIVFFLRGAFTKSEQPRRPDDRSDSAEADVAASRPGASS